MKSYIGAIKVTLIGLQQNERTRFYLCQWNTGFHTEYTDHLHNHTALIQRLNPNQEPCFFMVGNSRHIGISPLIHLQQSDSRYLEIEVPVQNRENQSSLSYQIINSQTEKPIPVVTCELRGHSIGEHGNPCTLHKRTISNNDRIALFDTLPLFIGTLKIHHGLYQPTEISVFNDGINTAQNKIISLIPLGTN